MDKCRSCGAPIKWVVTQKNRRMPVDLEPVEGGNIELHPQGEFRPPLAVYHSIRPPGIKYYISHFATCPKAEQHRRKQQKKDLPNPVIRGVVSQQLSHSEEQ